MEQKSAFAANRRAFWLRLLASYIVVPFVPALLICPPLGVPKLLPVTYWMGIVAIYAIFGFAAMVILGTPLLCLYLKYGWTGFTPFMIGAGACAGLTAGIVSRAREPGLTVLITAFGVIAGICFRLILFGFGFTTRNHFAGEPSGSDR
jgi:hypothetical protein